MSNYYVFRINYDRAFEDIKSEIRQGRLRQGWGAEGMSVQGSLEDYKAGWIKEFGVPEPGENIQGKYRNISIMKDMKPGDLIVIPKITLENDMDNRSSFTIVRVTGQYMFELLPKWGDFGHVIPVEFVLSCSYNTNDSSRNINKKMRAYQSPVNNCWNSGFCESVVSIIDEHSKNPEFIHTEKSEIEALSFSEKCKTGLKDYLDSIVKQINKWSGQKLEKLIIELFEKNNYRVVRTNHYDGKGADVDIEVVALSEDSLGYDLFTMNESMNGSDSMPRICIQAKNKEGSDSGDMNGVKQLVESKRNNPEKNASYILINLTQEFSQEARDEAINNNIMLINGHGFASILVKYGMDVCNF